MYLGTIVEEALRTGRVAPAAGPWWGPGVDRAGARPRGGAGVAVPYRHSGAGADAVAEAIRAAGGEAATVQADLAVSGDVRRLVTQVDARLGPVSVLVNNAGPFADTTFRTLTERDWDYVMTTNL